MVLYRKLDTASARLPLALRAVGAGGLLTDLPMMRPVLAVVKPASERSGGRAGMVAKPLRMAQDARSTV
jgi:hypothetical protein